MNWREQWVLSGDLKNVYMRLFSFSLAEKAKERLKSLPNQSLTCWKVVEEKNSTMIFSIISLD